jgi:hypothetical protein
VEVEGEMSSTRYESVTERRRKYESTYLFALRKKVLEMRYLLNRGRLKSFFVGKGEAMKRIILALTFLLATSSVASAQFTPSKENLRGLTGVTLMVMFHGPTRAEAMGETRAKGLEELQRPEVLKMLEDDMKAKLEKAGIPFSRSLYADKITKEYPRLIVVVRLSVPNGYVYPLESEVKLLQRARLVRDPSIEFDAVSWSLGGTGNLLELPMLRRVIAGVIDSFIRDYLAQNPKQSASSGKDKSRDTLIPANLMVHATRT